MKIVLNNRVPIKSKCCGAPVTRRTISFVWGSLIANIPTPIFQYRCSKCGADITAEIEKIFPPEKPKREIPNCAWRDE